MSRARCLTAEAEVALAVRDLAWPSRVLPEALRIFAAHGDRENEAHARLLQIRSFLLLGHIAEAERALASLETAGAPARVAAVAALVAFEIALRRGRAGVAAEALAVARDAAARSSIGALCAEVEQVGRALTLPAARHVAAGETRFLTLAEVEAVLASPALVVDGCRRAVRRGAQMVALSRRPVLFALLCALAQGWPGEVPRDALIQRAFGARRANSSHRVRLRVEIGRLRREIRPVAEVRATAAGFALVTGACAVRLLEPPIESPGASVLALLADGEAWSTSALALALGASQRTAQRALVALAEAGQVRALARGRSQRWVAAPVAAFATTLLLRATSAFE